MEAINLDLLPGAMPPIVHVSQGDVGRQFKIAIYDDTGAAYSLTGKTLSIVGHKGDGNVFQYAIPSSAVSGNEVTITTEAQMTPAAGKALCEISIEQNDTKLGTCNFIMDVEQGPADMGSLSISALYMIDALFERAQTDIDTATAAAATATQKANEANSSATAAAASAIAASTSASSAESSASTASSYASTAATEAGNASNYADAAALSATAAGTSATNAANSATAADTSATAAATSASSASTSASSASTYATAADNSADAASGYADAASLSATAASTSATNAAASETAASTSETNAASSATAASGSASDASTYANNASSSATAAAGSASDASTSASNAATSATNAAASEAKIANMTVSSQSVPYTQSANVVKTEVGGVYNLDFKIPRGEPTSGHDVEANPSGAASGDLTKLGIDGTNYNISGLPDYTQASQNDVLTIGQSGPEWAPPTGGSGAQYVRLNTAFTWTINISKVYSDSYSTKVYDRSSGSSFTFENGQTYYIESQIITIPGTQKFYDPKVSGWVAYAARCNAQSENFGQIIDGDPAELPELNADFGKFYSIIPYPDNAQSSDFEAGFSSPFSGNVTINFPYNAINPIKPSDVAVNTLDNQITFLVRFSFEVTGGSDIVWTPDDSNEDFDLQCPNSTADYKYNYEYIEE